MLPVIPFVFSATNTTPIVKPIDPNSILNPNGTGPMAYLVGADEVLSYTILFENLSTSGAPAQTVTVTQQLDPNLDWSTFQLGPITFAGEQYSVPLNDWADFPLANGAYYLVVTTALDVQTGVVSWNFRTTDPETDEPPEDITVGALPPDVSDGLGQGAVSYSLTPYPTTPTGTRINALATIQFDTQAPENTAQVFNTIDAGVGLTSTVAALPSDETLSTFNVAWSGSDANNGSAISGFNIYVSDNGGAFTPWLDDTTLTSATFAGQDGHSYGFYSVATDNAGNVEPTPQSAEASTVVDETVAQFDFSAPPTPPRPEAILPALLTAVTGITVGNTATAFSGIATVNSSDAKGVFPTNLTFVNGVCTFTATLQTAGYQTLNVADPVDGVPDTTDAVFVNAAPAADFIVAGPSTTTAGNTISFTVTAVDQFNNAIPGYNGVVDLQSTDRSASLPASIALTNGVGVFSGVLVKAGNQTVVVKDAASNGIAGTSMPITVQAAAITHFSIAVPNAVAAGQTLSFSVTAADQFGNAVTGYTGTVHFSSNESSVALPPDATLSNGLGGFSVVVTQAGPWLLTVGDTNNPGLTGTANAVTVTPLAATHLTVVAPSGVQAGEPFVLSVTALDTFNNIATGYTGSIRFTSSDNQAVLQPNKTLTAGAGRFAAILTTAGVQTIDATGIGGTGLAAVSNAVTVSAAAMAGFAVTAPASSGPGQPFSVTVTAQDSWHNTVASYSGVVHFASSDLGLGAALPPDSTLTAGTGKFTVNLVTSGIQTVTATDASNSGLTGSATIAVTVTSGAATHFVVSAISSATAGGVFACIVRAFDQFNNPAVQFSGTVHFISSDALANLPADATLVNGSGFFAVVLETSGNQTISVADSASSTVNGASAPIVVLAAAANHFSISAPATAITGSSFKVTVTALDQYGNKAASYSGTVHISSSDSAATLPASATVTAGIGIFTTILATAGSQTLTATDSTKGITGTSTISVLSLSVTSVTATPSGFVAVFNKPFNPAGLNLYDAASANLGPADITLVGPSPSVTAVRGSLVVDPTDTTITFVKTSDFNGSGFNPSTGILAAASAYAPHFLRSASNGFLVDSVGNLLAGNNGIEGDNYVANFVVGASPVVVGVPAFARGPGDTVEVPNTATGSAAGIPLNLSSAPASPAANSSCNITPPCSPSPGPRSMPA